MSTANDPWGRVADDGTVYVRTAEGERVVGSWQAGSPDEALAFFQRKFAALETEVSLLEQRIATTDLSPAQAQATITRLLAAVAERARGRRPGRAARPAGSDDRAGRPPPGGAQGRPRAGPHRGPGHARSGSSPRPSRSRPRPRTGRSAASGCASCSRSGRPRRAATGPTETALWKRLSAARNAFTKRRKAYFAGLEEEREGARARKEKLVTEAEALSGSTDWGPTASAYRELMRSWKEAGRADRGRRGGAVGPVQDGPGHVLRRRGRQVLRQGRRAARARRRQERTAGRGREAAAGHRPAVRPVGAARHPGALGARSAAVPRDAQERLEGGLRRVEEAVRKAEDTQWRRSNPEALSRARGTVEQIRSSDQPAGGPAGAPGPGATATAPASSDAEEALAARRSWLAEAERTLAELSG